MRRLWLLMALVILVLIDLSVVPTIVLWIYLGSILTLHGAPFLASIVLSFVFGAGLIWLTFVVGRAWQRSPRPRAAPPSG